MQPTVLSGHISPETAYVIGDYPYGRTLRCKKRVWLETTTKGAKQHQIRMVYQTTNPKYEGEVWNKPKAESYYDYLLLYVDPETGYLKSAGLYCSSSGAIEAFREKWYHLMPEDEKATFDGRYNQNFMKALRKMEGKINAMYSKTIFKIEPSEPVRIA